MKIIKKNENSLLKKIEDSVIDNTKERRICSNKVENNGDKYSQICNDEPTKSNKNTKFNDDNQSTTIEKITENDLKNYVNEVIKHLEEEKSNILKQEDKKEVIIKDNKSKKKKVTTIEVEENINTEAFPNMTEKNELFEVKDKIFKKNKHNILENSIYYEGKLFKKDRHQLKSYPNIVKYRCKNYRKKEKSRNTTFCSALIKRKIDKNKYYFILEQNHSKECLETKIINFKINTNLIGYYNE